MTKRSSRGAGKHGGGRGDGRHDDDATTPPPPSSLANLGPVTDRWLRGIGVERVDDLRAMGAVEAFGRVRAREGRQAATLNLLYALHAALEGTRWDALAPEVKARLREEAGVEPRGRGRRRA